MGQKDFYKTLGITREASEDEIKKAYRNLAKKHHPDVNKGDKKAEDRFKDIQEAYDVLGDKKKRQAYDMFGTADAGAGAGAGYPGGGQYYSYGGKTPQDGFDFSTFFGGGRASAGGGRGQGKPFTEEDLSSIFGDIFGAGGMGANTRRQKGAQPPVKGSDRYYTMEVDFLDAALGKTKKISLPENGKNTKINVKIPAGVDTGSKVRLTGKGEPSPNNGKPGDLYIVIQVRPHPYFTRKEDDVYLNLPISLEEAIRGASIDVPTVSGKIKMKIPSGTQGGQKMRLKGKGIAHRKNKGFGDQYIVINIQVPKNVDSEGKKIIQEFNEKYPFNPREGLF